MTTMPTIPPTRANGPLNSPENAVPSNEAATSQEPVDLERLFSHSTLPALPQSASRLLKLAEDPDVSPAAFAGPIEADAALAAQVLRYLNSSYFGIRRTVTSVKQGITLVGIRTIKNFVLWTAAYKMVPDPKNPVFSLERFRRDALRRGVFARTVTPLLGKGCSELAFTAALLQDIAVPFLARELRDRYAPLLEQRLNGRAQLSELERTTIGWTHGEAAGRLFQRWNLPAELAHPVLTHSDAESVLADAESPVESRAVALSSLLPAECDAVWNERPRLEACLNGLPSFSPLEELLEQVDQSYAELAESLCVSPAARTLVGWNEAEEAVDKPEKNQHNGLHGSL